MIVSEIETENGSETETETATEIEIGNGIGTGNGNGIGNENGNGSGIEITGTETVIKTAKGRKKRIVIEDEIEIATEIATEIVKKTVSEIVSAIVREKKIVRQIGAVSAAKKERKMSDAQEAALCSTTVSQRMPRPMLWRSQLSS